jgi:hypothetical protein
MGATRDYRDDCACSFCLQLEVHQQKQLLKNMHAELECSTLPGGEPAKIIETVISMLLRYLKPALEDGYIPPHTRCPHAQECTLAAVAGACAHKGLKHDSLYYCAAARAYAIIHKEF